MAALAAVPFGGGAVGVVDREAVDDVAGAEADLLDVLRVDVRNVICFLVSRNPKARSR